MTLLIQHPILLVQQCWVERLKDKPSGPILHYLHPSVLSALSVFLQHFLLTHKYELNENAKEMDKSDFNFAWKYERKVLFCYFRQLLKYCCGKTKCNLLQCIKYLLKSNEKQNKMGILNRVILIIKRWHQESNIFRGFFCLFLCFWNGRIKWKDWKR